MNPVTRARRAITDLLRSTAGAIDLASIMVGVLVIGIVGGAIAATVLAVVPWSQNQAAQQSLDSVAQAQSVARAQHNAYLDSEGLASAGYLRTDPKLTVDVSPDGKCYLSTATSDTGAVFYSTNHKRGAVTKSAAEAACEIASSAPLPAEMISTWDTSISGCTTITLPLGGTVSATVDWGDGTQTPATTMPSHTYTDTAGVHQVKISGTFGSWGAMSGWTPTCITGVTSWGNTETTSLFTGFLGATNLTVVNQVPASVTDMSYMFYGATAFNQKPVFDTKNVENMTGMFYGATAFNKPVTFDTSNVTILGAMFSGATSFNQPVTFNTPKLTNLTAMFKGATAFNQPVKLSSTALVTAMGEMFYNALSFNQPLDFNTSNVTYMADMFHNASSFNQPLAFDTSKVTQIDSMFWNATAFSQDISGWNIENARFNSAYFATGSGLSQAQDPFHREQ